MKKNLSNTFRIIRVIIAAILVALFFTGIAEGTWGIVALVVAAIMLITAAIGYCPLISIFCNGSCPFDSKK